MDAGRLNRRIRIEHFAEAQDEIGQPVQAWVLLTKAWANVRFLSGTETIRAGAVTVKKSASIRIRLRRDVTEGMRVVLDGVVFEIKSALPDEQNKDRTDLVCEVIA